MIQEAIEGFYTGTGMGGSYTIRFAFSEISGRGVVCVDNTLCGQMCISGETGDWVGAVSDG